MPGGVGIVVPEPLTTAASGGRGRGEGESGSCFTCSKAAEARHARRRGDPVRTIS